MRRVGEPFTRDARGWQKVGRLPVAEGDGAGLVEQQDVDVSGRLDRAPRHREHVALEQSVHAGDANRAQQPTDGRGNQAHEQGDERRDGKRRARMDTEWLERQDNEEENHGQRREHDREGEFVRRLLPGRALDEVDHVIEKPLAGIGGDAEDQRVGQHRGAAGHGAAVAAGLADHRRRFSRDGGFVDGRGAFDDLAITGNLFTGLHHDHVALAQEPGVDRFEASAARAALSDELSARGAQRPGLRFPASFRHRLGEVGEEHGEQQPERNLQDEPERLR